MPDPSAGAHGAPTHWISSLDRAAALLAGLSGSTERAFLAIGARVQDLQQESARLVDAGAAAAAALSPSRLESARQALSAVLDAFEAELRDEGSAGTVQCDLLQLLDELAGVRGDVARFERQIRMLRMLGISTKIESARLSANDSGFDTLSANVAALSVQIEQKLAAMSERETALARQIRAAIDQLQGLSAARAAHAREALGGTRKALGGLAETHRQGAQSAEVVARTSSEVASRISSVVTALQYHDITRQQIEHAHEALVALRAELSVPGDAAGLARDVADLADLAAAQLAGARSDLLNATAGVRTALGELVPVLAGLPAEARRITGAMTADEGTRLARLESGLEPIVARLSEDIAASSEIGGLVAAVATAVEQMSGFVTDIERVGFEIEKIALNASIKAAHMEAAGAVLGVLAEAIQDLSATTRDQTGSIAQPLRRALAIAGELGDRGAGHVLGIAQERERQLRQGLSELQACDRAARQRLAELERGATAIARELSAALDGFAIDREVEAILGGAIEGLAALARDARATAPPGSGPSGRLDALRQRYTTAGERDIHRLVVGAGEAAAEASSGSGSEFGDNVELF